MIECQIVMTPPQLRQLDLSPDRPAREIEIGIVTDALFAAQHHVTAAAFAGTIGRDEPFRLSYRMSLAAVSTFLD